MKYRAEGDFASSFRFYGSDGRLVSSTSSLVEAPGNRVYSNGYHEREWSGGDNPGFDPRAVYFVSAVEPGGESPMIRCSRV